MPHLKNVEEGLYSMISRGAFSIFQQCKLNLNSISLNNPAFICRSTCYCWLLCSVRSTYSLWYDSAYPWQTLWHDGSGVFKCVQNKIRMAPITFKILDTYTCAVNVLFDDTVQCPDSNNRALLLYTITNRLKRPNTGTFCIVVLSFSPFMRPPK